MKKIFLIIGILLVVGAAVAVAMAVNNPDTITGTWRYKIAVVVETPEGLRTGSAVREMNVTLKPRPDYKPHPYHATWSIKGEAVVVDLGDRGVLFALVDANDYRFVFEAFPSPAGGLTPEGVRYYDSLNEVSAVLEPGPLKNPILVYYTDKKDPKTVQRILPADLFSAFGEGVTLKKITLEITQEPVTWGLVEKHLPFFGPETGFLEWFKELPYGDFRRVGPHNFKHGG